VELNWPCEFCTPYPLLSTMAGSNGSIESLASYYGTKCSGSTRDQPSHTPAGNLASNARFQTENTHRRTSRPFHHVKHFDHTKMTRLVYHRLQQTLVCLSIPLVLTQLYQTVYFIEYVDGHASGWRRDDGILPRLTSHASRNHGVGMSQRLGKATRPTLYGTSVDIPRHNQVLAGLARKLCTRYQVINGQWTPVMLQRPPYISKTTHLRCHPLEHYKQSPFPWWAWTPSDSSCLVLPWNSNLFCNLLANTTITIIGDSLSWEQYSSLLQLLGQRVHQNDQHKSRDENKNHIQYACGNTVKLVWRNDAYLKNIEASIQEDMPNLIVLNRGAHYVSDEALLSDLTVNLDQLRPWQDTCNKQGRLLCLTMWRTTVPGTPQCNTTEGDNRYSEPNNNRLEMENLVQDPRHYNNVTINYHWKDFGRQNELVLDLWQKSGLDYSVIDAYELNILRPDLHRAHQGDCLHNCYPGKMDVYNQLLLHNVLMKTYGSVHDE
jgi:hypothetical protein